MAGKEKTFSFIYQEQLFRIGAIILANMEEEISQMIRKTPEDSFSQATKFHLEDLHFIEDSFGYRLLYIQTEKILGPDGLPVSIHFSEGGTDIGSDTDKELSINPSHDVEMSGESTNYYFTENGDYKKVLSNASIRKKEESEMTPEDFGIAQHALTFLKQRLESIQNSS